MPISGEERQQAVCAICGARPDDEAALIAWMHGVERGRTVWTCPPCARANLRSIEAKLGPGW